MKKLLLSAIVLSCAKLFSQPVFQYANLASVGFSTNISFAANVSPGPSGAAQSWNFASITPTVGGTLAIITPSTAPCIGSFAGANYVESIPGGQYNFYALSSSKVETMAENITASCTGGSTYSNYKQILKFPFNYLDTYTDAYNDGSPGTVTVTCDAYGTLTTPYGTYTNVLRILTVDGSTSSYQWVTTGANSFPVMIINTSSTIFFYGGTSGIKETQADQNSVQVYPNPASSVINIETSSFEENSGLILYNSIGQAVLVAKTSGEKTSINVGSLPKGLYTLELKNASKSCVKKIAVE